MIRGGGKHGLQTLIDQLPLHGNIKKRLHATHKLLKYQYNTPPSNDGVLGCQHGL